MAELPEVLETVVVGPHDCLVIVLPNTTTREQFDRVQDVVGQKDSMSGRILIVANIEQLAVLRGEHDG